MSDAIDPDSPSTIPEAATSPEGLARRRTSPALLGVIAAIVIGGIALLTIGGGGGDDNQPAGAEAAAGAGSVSELPTDTFERFEGGEATFAEFEGKPIVLNFWASWCPACVAELPEFEAVHQDVGDEVTFIGMANADVRDNATAMAADVGLTYTLVDDPEAAFFEEFGLISMPSTVFITPDGRIHERFGGVLNETLLRQKIDELIAAS